MSDVVQFERAEEPREVKRDVSGVVIGILTGFSSDGVPLVDFEGNPKDDPVATRTTAVLTSEDVGREVALIFERADLVKPILIGLIVYPSGRERQAMTIQRDDERIEFRAEREIVLRCGAASITLTRAGKVLIRGAYVSSRSSGVNMIKGGSVHIN